MELGSLLKDARLKRGASVRQMAKRMGIDHTRLFAFENGDTNALGDENFIKLLLYIFGPRQQ